MSAAKRQSHSYFAETSEPVLKKRPSNDMLLPIQSTITTIPPKAVPVLVCMKITALLT